MDALSNDPQHLNSFAIGNGQPQQDRRNSRASNSPLARTKMGPQSYEGGTTNDALGNLAAFSTGYDSAFVGNMNTQPFVQQVGGPASVQSDHNSVTPGHNGFGFSSPSEFTHQRIKSDHTSPEMTSVSGMLRQEDGDGSSIAQDGVDGDDPDDADKRDEKGDLLPAWSDMKTKAGKERKRLPLACIACRRKKIRCSGEKPACKHCMRSRIPCVYKVTARKAAPRTDYMAMLDKRLRRMEDRVIKLIPKEAAANVGRAVLKPQIPVAPPKPPGGNKKRVAEEAFDHGLQDWAKSKVQDPTDKATSRVNETDESQLQADGSDCLPSKEIQEHLSEIYFEYVYGQSYPLLHKPSFMRKLAAGTIPPVLVLAVCAISARFSSHPSLRTEPAFLRGEDWATKAREIALRRYDSPNITILIVYLLLGLHEFGTCQGGRSWMLGGMAQRMAYALQLHRDLEHEPRLGPNGEKVKYSHTDREIRRRTMWSCFLMDRFNSSGSERPLFVSEQYIKAQLPIRETFFQMEIEGPTENLEGDLPQPQHDLGELFEPKENMGVMAYLIRLVCIWGKLIQYLNLGGKEKDPHPMWTELSGFLILRKEIDTWKADLPSLLEWSVENLQTHATEKTANQYIYVHILYSQIILFMNRFALPMVTGARLPPDMPAPFIQEAARQAIEAANQISVLINEGHFYNVTAPFAGYAAFFSSTVHIYGVFSKQEHFEKASKKYLAFNVKYLSRMKKWWGMFHFVAENLKDLYRQHADAALRGPSATNREALTRIFQYGDWFDKYPNGVSKIDYEDPVAEVKAQPGDDAVLSEKADLRTVEEFFASLSPPSRADAHYKQVKKAKANKKADGIKAGPEGRRASAAQESLTKPLLQQQPQKQQHPALSALHTQFDPSFYPHGPTSAPVQNFGRSATFPTDFSTMSLQTPLSATSSHGQHPGPQQQHQSPITPFDPGMQSGMPNYWNMDLAQFQPPMGNLGGPGGYDMGNSSNSWFMPFNMEPPDLVNDDIMAQGNAFDFTAFAAGDGPPGEGDFLQGMDAMGQHDMHPNSGARMEQ